MLCKIKIKVSLTGQRNTEVEKAEQREGFLFTPKTCKALFFSFWVMYKHLTPQRCEWLTVRQRWPEAPRTPVHSKHRLWGRQTGKEGKRPSLLRLYSPAGRKEAAVPLLSLPDCKAWRHDVILRGTGLSLAKEVSLLPPPHEVIVVNVHMVNTSNAYIATQEMRGWLSCFTVRLRTVATIKDAWPFHSLLIIKHCFQILTTWPNINYLNLISM